MRIILTILVLTSPVFAQDNTAVAKALAACGPAEVQFDVSTDKNKHPAARPDGGKASVYVVEIYEKLVDTINMSSPTTKVGLDGAWVGANKGNSYFFFFVDPGEHHLCANWQSHLRRVSKLGSLAGFRAEAGKVYYFRHPNRRKAVFDLQPQQEQRIPPVVLLLAWFGRADRCRVTQLAIDSQLLDEF